MKILSLKDSKLKDHQARDNLTQEYTKHLKKSSLSEVRLMLIDLFKHPLIGKVETHRKYIQKNRIQQRASLKNFHTIWNLAWIGCLKNSNKSRKNIWVWIFIFRSWNRLYIRERLVSHKVNKSQKQGKGNIYFWWPNTNQRLSSWKLKTKEMKKNCLTWKSRSNTVKPKFIHYKWNSRNTITLNKNLIK